MTIEKFFKNTGYAPDIDEFDAIRDSFYELNVHENDFYRIWLQKKASGEWDQEYARRRSRKRR